MSLEEHATVLLIQMGMLAVYHRTEPEDPNGGVRGRTEGAEGVCNLEEEQQHEPTRYPRTPKD